MGNTYKFAVPEYTGQTTYVTIEDAVAGTAWNGAAMEAYTVANYANYDVAAPETPASSGHFQMTMPALVPAGTYTLRHKHRAGASTAALDTILFEALVRWDGTNLYDLNEWLRSRIATALPNAAPGGAGGLALYNDPMTVTPDSYWFKLCFTRDQRNDRDEVTLTWMKNVSDISDIGLPATNPTLQIIKRADGTDLLPQTAMTKVSGLQDCKADITAAVQRLTKGEAAKFIGKATIDGVLRTWSDWRSRDT